MRRERRVPSISVLRATIPRNPRSPRTRPSVTRSLFTARSARSPIETMNRCTGSPRQIIYLRLHVVNAAAADVRF